MFCTDLLVDVAVHRIRNATKRIPAQNIHVVSLRKLVAEFLHLNGRLWFTLCPQEMHTFSKNSDSRMLSLGSLCRCEDQVAKGVHKSSRIRHVIEHEFRERVSSIQGDISALFHSGIDIRAVCLQSGKE